MQKPETEEAPEILRPKDWNDMEVIDFLSESNKIEGVYSIQALEDAIEAWNFAFLNKDKIDLAYILEIHRLLGQRIAPNIAGKWRDCGVWIGGKHKPFISEGLIKEQVSIWIKKSKVTKRKKGYPEWERDRLVREWHVTFEEIHPFVDINGRTGRILWNIQRLLLGLPLLVIDSRTKEWEYYVLFKD